MTKQESKFDGFHLFMSACPAIIIDKEYPGFPAVFIAL